MKPVGVLISCFSFALAVSTDTRTLYKDIAIIGGGASGAYAALRLKEDYKKSIVLIEKQDTLGGHVNPYNDPVTGQNFDLGVQSFLDYGVGLEVFARLNVSTGPRPTIRRNPPIYADFTTGNTVQFTARAFDPEVKNALQIFHDALAPYESFYQPGYFNFPSPKDIPEDLLLPFGEFVSKYKIEALVTSVFQSTGLGMGDLLGSTTLYVLTTFGGPMARSLLGEVPVFGPASGRNIELYENIAKRLGHDVLYSTTVVQTSRPQQGPVTLVVQNSKGQRTRIIAKKLLISIAPTQDNLKPFSLDKEEKNIFDKLFYSNEYVALVTHPSLPSETSIFNLPESAAPSNTLHIPKGNFTSGFTYHGAGSKPVWRVVVVGEQGFTPSDARALVHARFDALMKQGTIAQSTEPLEILDLAVHGAMHMRFEPGLVKKGYIQKMYSLQGKRNTWWTGGAWSCGFQTVLWTFDNVLLEKMFSH